MSNSLQILFVGIAPPAPTTSGQRMRTRVLLEALRDEGHKVTLVTFAEPAEVQQPDASLASLCTECQLLSSPASGMAGGEYWKRLLGLFSSAPYGARRMRSERMSAVVRRTLAKNRFDLVICADVYMLANLPEELRIPVLLNKDDLTFVIVNQYASGIRNPLTKIYARAEYKKIFKLETRSCSQVAGVLVCSEADKEALQRFCPTAHIFVAPNVVNVKDYQPVSTDDKRTILFFGAMDWLPNRDAVEYFVADILPVLRRKISGFRFVIAGRNPSEQFRRRFENVLDLEFTGTVEDMRTIIANAAVCVVPLRIGSGTRLKILEAAAMGKAIVSTPLGAEGLEFRDGVEILLAGQPDDFAQGVAALFNDAPRRIAVGSAARRAVEQRYSVPALRERLRAALASVRSESANFVDLRQPVAPEVSR
jgi:polysaccharide biosynthesis protein PslH